MIPIEKLRAIKHLVTHINCPDGVATAMIIQDVLPGIKVTFCQYDTIEHKTLNPEPGMLFCDFSPYKERTAEFIAAGAIVLDHHKTQKDVVAQFLDNGVFADEKEEPSVCGASLAFREVWLPLKSQESRSAEAPPLEGVGNVVAEFARLAGIRDTWQRTSPDWLKACEQAEALTFWPVEDLFVHPSQWAEKLALGPVLYERRLRSAHNCLEKGFVFRTPKGRKVIVFEGLKPTSDASDIDEGEHDVVIGFGYNAEDLTRARVVFSTRSRNKFDCSAFCLAHGGGGHTSAAGFSRNLRTNDRHPYEMIRDLFLAYEGVEDQWRQVVAESTHNVVIPMHSGGTVERIRPKFEPEVAYANLLIKNPEPANYFLLDLDRYQRDNLVWLLKAVGYSTDPKAPKCVEPFGYANTGDWVGQIASQLDCHKGVGTPLLTEDELRSQVAGWLEHKKDEAEESDDEATVTVKMSLAVATKIKLFTFLKENGFEAFGEFQELEESPEPFSPNDVQ